MEVLTLLLIAGLIWGGIVWLKRYAPLTSIIADLFGSTAAVMERITAPERRANALTQTGDPEGASHAPPSEADATVEVQPDQRVEVAVRKWAASTFPGERVDTPPEPKPFMVLTQEPQAPPPLAAEEIGELRVEGEARRHPVAAVLWAASKPATTDRALPVRQAEPEGISSGGIDFSQINRATRHAVRAWQLPAVFRKRTGEPPDWEALIGGSWLNVIGIVIFVLGMVLLAQYSLRQFGPLGKIATGAVSGIVFIGCGVLLERAERYRLIAWTLVGGGWALLYFTAYAAYNIAASRIIADPAIGLLVLSVVASGIIVHSLKYRSQLVTGLAYGLGFLAVAMTPLNAYTLAATALLAGSQIALLRFLGWHYLALIAVAGTYLNHARWLGEVIGTRPDFWLSQGILAFYWILFVIVGLVRRPASSQESLIHLTINVANAIGLLGLSAWQIWVLQGENLHYLTASAMLAYVVAAGASRLSNRPDLLRFNGSVAVLLFALTLPLALGPLDISGDWLAIYWVLGGVLTVACGYLLREPLLRLEGYALCGVACLAVLSFNLESALPLADWQRPRWWIAPAVAVIFLGLSGLLQRAAGREGVLPGADQLGRVYGYAATAIVAVFLWRISDPYFVGLSWLVAGLVFFEAGAGWPRPLLRNQAYVLFGLAFAALLAINLYEIYPASAGLAGVGLLPRPVIVGLSVSTYYYLFWRLRRERCGFAQTAAEPAIADLFSIAGSTLLAALAWRELDPTLVALAWISIALALFEVGAGWPRPLLRNQAYVLFGLAFAALLAINLYEIYPTSAGLAVVGLLPRPVIVGLSAAACHYLFWRLRRERCGFAQTVAEPAVADLFSIAGSTLLVALAWKELDPDVVALGWVAMGVALFEVGARWPRPLLRNQAYVLFGLAFAALLAINLYEIYPPAAKASTLPRWFTVGLSATAIYWVFWQLHPKARHFVRTDIDDALADYTSIAATVLFTILAWKELDSVTVALAWGLFALILFEVGHATRFARITPQAHALAGLTFGRLFMANFIALGESMGISHRLLTVLPITVLFYYFYSQTTALPSYRLFGKDLQISRLYSWGAAIVLLALMRFELGRAYAVTGLAPMFVALVILGRYLNNKDFRLQGYLLAILTFARCWATNAYLVAAIYGVPERIVTMLSVVIAFALATAICMRATDVRTPSAGNIFARSLSLVDANPHRFFALLGAALMAILFYYGLPVGWVTLAFAIEALILILGGLATEERSFRIYGLALLLIAVLKLVIIDASGVDPIYRILSYIGLGLILLIASMVYTRYRSVIEKYV